MTLFDAALEPTVGPYRAGQPDTAKQAAVENAPRSGSQRGRVLAALVAAGDQGLTDWELHFAAQILRAHTAGTRRAELQKLGYVEATDQRRRTDTDSLAVVWRVTAAGRDVFKAAS